MAYTDPLRAKEYKAEWVKRNKEHVLQKDREWKDANREKVRVADREYTRKYRKENPERIRETRRKRLKKSKAYLKAYRQRDYVKVRSNENGAKRRALEMRTSKFELNSYGNILKLFKLSNKKTKETGRDYHVDHIVPLQGRLVSGFHISGNLRVILAKTNTIKHNHYTAGDEALIHRRMVKDWIANGVDFKLYKPKKKRKAA